MKEIVIQAVEIDLGKDKALLHELAQPAAKLFDRHLEVAKTWYPYEEVPFDVARTFTNGYQWSAEEYPLEQGVRSAIFINLITEEKLPDYTSALLSQLRYDHPLRDWIHRWTAEEGRHAPVIRDWALATRAIDPKQLEDTRMLELSSGKVPELPTVAEMIIYTSLQELATQVAHRNTGKALDKERMGKKVMNLVAGDEGLHYDFYSGLGIEAFQIDPSTMVLAAMNQIRSFEMPGNGIPGFKEHARAIAEAQIYGFSQFLEVVITPTLKRWNIDMLDGLTPEAEEARLRINKHIALLGRVARRQHEKDSTLEADLA